MSLERVQIERARPLIAAAKASASAALVFEVTKGCRPEGSPVPVALEPPYRPLSTPRDLLVGPAGSSPVAAAPPAAEELVRLRMYISANEPFGWNRCELFVKQLAAVQHRVGLEISGNMEGQAMGLLCHRVDAPSVAAAFMAAFAGCELADPAEDPGGVWRGTDWHDVALRDFYPPPPYSHLLTQPSEFRESPYTGLFVVLSQIAPPAMGLFQCLFQPVHPGHDWHQNIRVLLDAEFKAKLALGFESIYRHPQQSPSADLKQMAWQTEAKAHNDKPLFAVALRLAVLNANGSARELLRPLAAFVNLFQHGGRPLAYLTEDDYDFLTSAQRAQLFRHALTYRSGFLANSAELSGLVHVPPAGLVDQHRLAIELLDDLVLPDDALTEGVCVGTYRRAGKCRPVRIPAELRLRGVHIVGAMGCGKSCLLCNPALSDVADGAGVAVIDPHGDLARVLLGLLPEAALERTVYFYPGDPEWVPVWNPLQPVRGLHHGRVAGELVTAFKSFTEGWGDRLAHLLRQAFFGLLHRPGSTLLDAAKLLREKSPTSEVLRAELERLVDNPMAQLFWKEDFSKYRRDATGPPQHKLGKLLVSQTDVMFSQPDSLIDLRRIMNERMIFIANLSGLETETADTIGALLLALFYALGLGRAALPPEQRVPFHLYVDEAHRFVTDALHDLLCQMRKFNVSVTLAHQHLSQFAERPRDALAAVGTAVMFGVGPKDATRLADRTRGKVKAATLINLPPFTAILHAGEHLARIETPRWNESWDIDKYNRAVAWSRQHYCRRIGNPRRSGDATAEASGVDAGRPAWETEYDVFD
jgi:hypothetical protein